MKTYTNYAQGTRGIRTESGMVYIDPGKSADIDPKTIIGEVPDLGKKSDADADGPDAGDFDALTAQVADLTKQVEELEGDKAELAKTGAAAAKEAEGLKVQVADLTKQVEALKKPATK